MTASFMDRFRLATLASALLLGPFVALSVFVTCLVFRRAASAWGVA
jgi:hypothetical protein